MLKYNIFSFYYDKSKLTQWHNYIQFFLENVLHQIYVGSHTYFTKNHNQYSFPSVVQPLKYFPVPEGSLLQSQEPSTCPCPRTDKSSPYHPIVSLQDPP
jgi:hypothetical protein